MSPGIDVSHYHSWKGPRRSPWFGALAVARVSALQIFRRKLYWFALGLGLMIFLLYFALIYIAAQLESGAGNLEPGTPAATIGKSPANAALGPKNVPRERGNIRSWLLSQVNFSPQPGEQGDNGYLRFMERQSIVVIILLAFSGSLAVGSDYRQRSLAFYLSRRIDRRHYAAGKLLGLSIVIAALTVLPAIVLFLQYGMFTSSIDYWIEFWWIVPAVLGYGLVLCLVLGLVTITLSAYLQRTAPIAITCFSLFLMLNLIAPQLRERTGNAYWSLVDLWRDMRFAARYCFDPYCRPDDRLLGPWAIAILSVLCVACGAALFQRVRAVEVVE
jgi:ABC-type transport system involved in multi-copper enzyme maturation permease subunit